MSYYIVTVIRNCPSKTQLRYAASNCNFVCLWIHKISLESIDSTFQKVVMK